MWGSHSMLAQFQGRAVPTQAPEAELWFGAHPLAPSSIEADGLPHRLDTFISDHPSEQLGDHVARRFGKLPFLLKVLAVDQPLSIQVHPSLEQARAGFVCERSRGVAADDPQANYRDDWAKPELLCPLSPFEALCGFRSIKEIIGLLSELGGDCFARAAACLGASPNAEGLREVVASWMRATGDEKATLYRSAIFGCSRAASQSKANRSDVARTLDLAERYPGDMGALVALLLRHLLLAPGTGLYVPPGTLHAYLHGFAVEVMASSDNVLRGGLTPKRVDVDELLALTHFDADSSSQIQLVTSSTVERIFITDTPHFRVSFVDVATHMPWCANPRTGPEMLLCLGGGLLALSATGEPLSLSGGECAWISADEDVYCVSGAGKGCRVQVGE